MSFLQEQLEGHAKAQSAIILWTDLMTRIPPSLAVIWSR